MIVVGLMGGLGNQMFQYACARAVARRLNTGLRLDVTMLQNRNMGADFTYRDYELSHFNVREKLVTHLHNKLFVPDLFSATEKMLRKCKRVQKVLGYHLYREQKEFSFEERVLQIRNNTYLFGYFQTEKYFKDIRDDLLKTFRLMQPLDVENQNILNEIKRTTSVSIHVRRGDYLKSVNSIFQVLTVENYYAHAIKIIQQEVKSPHFFVFSDDLHTVKKEFASLEGSFTFVSVNNGNQSYKDMVLMSQCKHYVIANSSFSWWAAWLNSSREKTVIAPDKWFRDPNMASQTTDLLPSDWKVLMIES